MDLERGGLTSFITYLDHHTRVLQSFQHFQERNEFIDATIVCDKHSFSTSKMLLASLSPFFYKLLKTHHSSHPTIYIPDISATTMQKILVFIYKGTVQLENHEIEEFLKAAHMFELVDIDIASNRYIKSENLATDEELDTESPIPEDDDEIVDDTEYNFGIEPDKVVEQLKKNPVYIDLSIEEEIELASQSLTAENCQFAAENCQFTDEYCQFTADGCQSFTVENCQSLNDETCQIEVIEPIPDVKQMNPILEVPQQKYNLRSRAVKNLRPGLNSPRRSKKATKASVVCLICKQTFKTKKLLNFHLDFTHMEKPKVPNIMKYEKTCDRCNRKFKTCHNFNMHRTYFHKIPEDGDTE